MMDDGTLSGNKRRDSRFHRRLVTLLVALIISNVLLQVKSFVILTSRKQSTSLYEESRSSNFDYTGKDLLKSLDESFDYKGRLPSYTDKDDYRCGFVSIVGAANMGKSTLLNVLLEENLCVTTRKPQTTRHAILGVLTTDQTQLCLVDTPGVIEEPAYKLQEGMMEAVVGALQDSNIVLVVTDLFSTPIPNDSIFSKVQQTRKPVIVVINKIDLADQVNPNANNNDNDDNGSRTVTVPDAVQQWRTLLPNAIAILPISAGKGPHSVGIVALRKLLLGYGNVPAALRDLGRPIPGMFPSDQSTITDEEARALLPLSPPLYDKETLTDRSERFFASEMIRAALFVQLKKELPYCCEVRVTEFKESSTIIRIKATVLVERDSQKSIVIGKGGQVIKSVGMEARRQLEDFFQSKVHLELNVNVDKDWRKNESRLKQFGYL